MEVQLIDELRPSIPATLDRKAITGFQPAVDEH